MTRNPPFNTPLMMNQPMTQAATLTLYLKHFYTQSSSKTKAISTYPFYSLEQKDDFDHFTVINRSDCSS